MVFQAQSISRNQNAAAEAETCNFNSQIFLSSSRKNIYNREENRCSADALKKNILNNMTEMCARFVPKQTRKHIKISSRNKAEKKFKPRSSLNVNEGDVK